MRINDCDTVPECDMLNDHVPQQSALSRARLADDVTVMPRIIHVQTNRSRTSAPVLPVSHENEIVHTLEPAATPCAQVKPPPLQVEAASFVCGAAGKRVLG